MTKIRLIRRALRLWNVPYVSRETNRANARKWLRSVEMLGGKWLLAKNVERLEEPRA